MAKAGQQHPKADVGGQRTEPSKSDDKKQGSPGDVSATMAAGKKSVAKTDVKK